MLHDDGETLYLEGLLPANVAGWLAAARLSSIGEFVDWIIGYMNQALVEEDVWEGITDWGQEGVDGCLKGVPSKCWLMEKLIE